MFTPRPVVWSCDAPLPEAELAGYAWDGADLVIGTGGAQAAGRVPPLGADGCHLTCRKTATGHLIAADSRGQARLFLYADRGRWAVANGFAPLVRAVAARGWRLRVRPWALAAWSAPQTAFDQLPWTATAAAEIRLVPAWAGVAVTAGRAQVVTLPRPVPATLDEALRPWLSRLVTLLRRPGLRLAMDLTGGLDSRCTLAMALYLRESGQLPDLDALRFVSARHQAGDLAVAGDLAARYGLRLNVGQEGALRPRSLSDRFALWQDVSLGSFAGPYLPLAQEEAGLVTVGGQGGEYLRSLDWVSELAPLQAEAPRGFLARRAFRAELARAWDMAQGALLPGAPQATQYRWAFRLRALAGHHCQMGLRLTPLAGAGFAGWAATRPPAALQGGRLPFEILHRLAPELVGLPFLDPTRCAPPDLGTAAASLPPPLIAEPGQVWAEAPTTAPPPEAADPTPPATAFAHALDAAEAAGAARLIGPAPLKAARAALAAAPAAGLPDRLAFRPVHLGLLAGLLAGAAQS